MNRFLSEQVELVPLERLQEHPANPNRGDDAAVAQGIETLGFWGALIVQRSTSYILAGNTRYRALQRAGYTHAPVMWVDVDTATAHRILLADNRLATFAETDEDRLASLLKTLHGEGLLLGTGYTDLDLSDLLGTLDETPLPETEAGFPEEPDLERLVVLLDRAGYERVTDWLSRWMTATGAAGYGEVLQHLLTVAPAPAGAAPTKLKHTGRRSRGAG